MSEKDWIHYFNKKAEAISPVESYKLNGFKSKKIVDAIRYNVRASIDLDGIPSAIFDIGCGDGSVTCSFVGKTRVYGCDGSKNMLNRARDKGLIPIKIDFDKIGEYDLPISRNCCIVLCECLVCAKEPLKLIDYLTDRSIEFDSALVISIPNSKNVARIIINFLTNENLNYLNQSELESLLIRKRLRFSKKYVTPKFVSILLGSSPKNNTQIIFDWLSFNIIYKIS